MREVAMILTTTVLSGLVLMGVMFFVAPPVLGPVLVAIARLPSPFGEVAWLAVLFPLVVIGPPMVWDLPDRFRGLRQAPLAGRHYAGREGAEPQNIENR